MDYKTIKYLLTLLLILFACFLIYLVSFVNFTLNEIQSLFAIVSSLSIGIALLTYFTKKNQDELLSTIDQVTLFREKIIPTWASVQKDIQERNPQFILSNISLENPDINYIRTKFPENFNRQLSVFFSSSKNYPNPWIDGFVLDNQILLLNMFEEFSLRVIHLKTDKNRALQSVQASFVQIIEQNAVALMFMRQVKSGNQTYSSILNLYKFWKNNVTKINFIKNLEVYGFISKKQKSEIFDQRREKFGF